MISWPWDSVVTGFGDNGFPIYDRSYKAEQLREVLKRFFSNGVFIDEPNQFHVTPGEGMNVIVDPGTCFIQGDVAYEQSQRELAIQAPSSEDRIDTVIIRWDANIEARTVDLYVLQGVASATPVRPTLTRTESVWEIGLCDIFIPKNSSAITADRITDTRLQTARCGAVTPLLNVDTTTFFSQIQAAVDRAVDLANSALGGTIPGQIQQQIDTINLYIPKESPEPEWVSHRNVYRGKYLGNEFTAEQKSNIADGSFEDLYVGDYWSDANTEYVIVDINYWVGAYSNNKEKLQTPHIAIGFVNPGYAKMDTKTTNASGYLGAYMKTTYIPNVSNQIKSFFGENSLVVHQERFSNSVSTASTTLYPTTVATAYSQSTIDTPTASMIFGSKLVDVDSSESGTDLAQLSYFRLRPNPYELSPKNRFLPFWLRNVLGTGYIYYQYNGGIGTIPPNTDGVFAYLVCGIKG